MRKNRLATGLVTLTFAVALPFQAVASPTSQAPVQPPIEQQVSEAEVQELAAFLEKMTNATSYDEVEALFVDTFGEED
ncbi:hypothetical protein [Corynebacterium pseudopelargi]|uniref:Uncharacterized protein n=1 Tax=Corynebacterium pseudopelargi TaxID=2080757 RepID=A0A3G6IRQ4_9CORY|nr:hypothetical protein [Corynebacterium pseudopelargi]AZA08223.1 hypothetical protein CPPEL_00360 [Corynebacterium pseudopelargi]